VLANIFQKENFQTLFKGVIMLSYVTTFKSGNDYTTDDVIALANQVKKNLSIPHEFICYSDTPIYSDLVTTIDLKNHFPGDWYQLEAWKHTGATIISDLNILITGNIDELAKIAKDCAEDEIYMCRPQIKKIRDLGHWASKVVVFNGDWSFVYRKPITSSKWVFMQISSTIKDSNNFVNILQDEVDGIYSFNYLPQHNVKPDDAKIIFFNKRPLLSACKLQWVKDIYNEIILHSSKHVSDETDQPEDQPEDQTPSCSAESNEYM